MSADAAKPPTFDPIVLQQLACPACLGGLSLVGERLLCAVCGSVFPIVDGIPVLIAERGKLS
jgi:hypothetical protein